MSPDIIDRVRLVAQKWIPFLPRALNRMNSPDRMINRHEVRAVIFHGEPDSEAWNPDWKTRKES